VEIKRAIIYTRVSSDRSEYGRSVSEQEQSCLAVAQQHGWPVHQVLVDNDKGASRWSKSKRPSYDELKRILLPGDVLVTWEASRAQRDMRVYLTLRDLCEQLGVYWCYQGRVYDLSRHDDRFTTGLDALLAEKEVDLTRERIMRTLDSNLAAGKPHGRPAYGYMVKRDPKSGKAVDRVPHPDEAPIVQEMVRRVLDGDKLRSIAADFNARGVKSSEGVEWTGSLIAVLLRKPTYAGLRSHKGKIVGKGTWEPLITEDEYDRLTALLKDPARRTQRGTAAKSLLTGIAVCGVCGSPCGRHRHSGTYWTYTCRKGGHVTRKMETVDDEAVDFLLAWLVRPEVVARLQQTDDGPANEARKKADALRIRMRAYEIEAMKPDSSIPPDSFGRMMSGWAEEIARLQEVITAAAPRPRLASIAGPEAPQIWEGLTLDEQREIVREALSVTINRASEDESLVIDWRGY
jgi:site-specific DNA recombinase